MRNDMQINCYKYADKTLAVSERYNNYEPWYILELLLFYITSLIHTNS